jgi:hypothetical protein
LLAAGQRAFGHPWYGVVIGAGLMCGCICWMLQGWLPPNYALLGGLFAGAQFGVVSYWVNSYWGGALAAAGGALVLGSVPRLTRRIESTTAALAAVGMVTLAMTRPFEGLILTATSAVVLLWWMHRAGRDWRSLFQARSVIAASLVLAAAFSWMAYYNYRLTGHALVMPYVVNEKMYAASPHFWFLSAGAPPTYRHEVIRKLWADWDHGNYLDARAHPWQLPPRLALILLYPLSTVFRLCLFVAVGLGRSRKVRIALAIAGIVCLAMLMETAVALHYFAPAIGLLFLLIVSGWRRVVQIAHSRSAWLGKAAVVVLSAAVVYALADGIYSAIKDPLPHKFAHERADIVSQLMQQGPRHLVIVRYAPDHDFHVEWVQNQAAIDASSIVWARDMGDTANRELLEYYRDRRAWLLEPDALPIQLKNLE